MSYKEQLSMPQSMRNSTYTNDNQPKPGEHWVLKQGASRWTGIFLQKLLIDNVEFWILMNDARDEYFIKRASGQWARHSTTPRLPVIRIPATPPGVADAWSLMRSHT